MATVQGLATTFDLPNYVGELYQLTPTDTPFLSAMGGLSGGGDFTTSTQIQWQNEDLRPADQRVKLEGQNAPTLESRPRTNAANVVQIVQEAYGVSYTKQAATGQYGGINIAGSNPVQDEFGHQAMLYVKQIARDLEYAFINGRYHLPTDNTTARKTKGIIQATETNVSTAAAVDFTNGGAFTVTAADPGVFTTTGGVHGLSVGNQIQFTEGSGVLPTIELSNGVTRTVGEGITYYIATVPSTTTFTVTDTKGSTTGLEITAAGTSHATRVARKTGALTEAVVLDLMQKVFDNGGIMEEETRTLMCNSWLKRMLTSIFITNKGYDEESRNMAGVRVTTIETDFGRVNIMLNRHMPNGTLQVVSMEHVKPCYLMIPGKGFLFSEMLAKTGAEIRAQIYGEVGLKWGNELAHGKITHLSASA